MDIYYVAILDTNARTTICEWDNLPKGFEADIRKRLFDAGRYGGLGGSIAHLYAITGLWPKESMVRTCIERGAALVDNGQKHFYTLPELTDGPALDDANIPRSEIVFISKEHPGICCIVVYKLVQGESFETQRLKSCPLLLDPPDTRKSEAIAQTLAGKIAKRISGELRLGVDPKTLSIEQCVADTVGNWAKLVDTQLELEETTQVLSGLVERVLYERGEKLENLNAKSEGLGKQSKLFARQAKETNKVDIWYYLCCRPM